MAAKYHKTSHGLGLFRAYEPKIPKSFTAQRLLKIGYPFFGGPISLSSVWRLRHCRFLGGPIALQCFVHISDKSAFAILRWLPF